MATFLDGRDRPAFGLWCSSADPLVAEVLAASGPDYVCIDTQHGASHEGNLVSMCQAVTVGGAVPVVRVSENRPALIMKALDCGARGVIVPLIETAADAAAAVAACRYPPLGERSWGPFRASLAKDMATRAGLEDVACVVMIETKKAVENLAEIVATDGLAGAYFGPSDLSLALGLEPASFDAPEFQEVLAAMIAECGKKGISAGAHCYDGATASKYSHDGFSMITLAVDMRLLRSAAAAEIGIAAS
ncbi:MAG TPA: aldolase/citrate lyase family protein [Trebonia sp.]|jgi:4-hydroxy-2-oxoheptanedioate aldolase